MSSLERLPSDETDDGNVRLTEPETAKLYNPGININTLPSRCTGRNETRISCCEIILTVIYLS